MPEHLRLEREVPITERHRRPNRRPRFKPSNPRQFGQKLAARMDAAKYRYGEVLGGYDQRRLLKIVLRPDESLPDFEAIPGIELVSHEDRSLVLAFATTEGIEEFEARLTTLSQDGAVTRAQLLYAIEDFGHWTPEDRTGNALRDQGLPEAEPFLLDVELWPQERSDRRRLMLDRFRNWLTTEDIEVLDTISQPSLVMARVQCNRAQTEDRLLHHRDVRTVDLPPQFGIQVQMLSTDIGSIPSPVPPNDQAPSVTVLDSGLTSGHPLIGPAVGDSQGFVPPEHSSEDQVPRGHGTFVSGLALYGDIANLIQSARFVPKLRLFSGKVFRDDGTDQTEFVERSVENAVKYFLTKYGCRIFTLCYGDFNKVYDGRRLRGIAYTLDHLSRTLGVLFVVSAGNWHLGSLPDRLRERYPEYLFNAEGRILDPGTALNAVTVGALARYDRSLVAQRYPNSLENFPVAQNNQPSPITRCGPSVNRAIKPDFVAHGGNVAIDRMGNPQTGGLGVLSLNSGYATGRPFCEDIGTSYAAPLVAHMATRLLVELPDASPILLRALLGAHARWPSGCIELLDPDENANGREKLLRSIGYGLIDEEALYQSLNHTVTLIAEENIDANRHHFFEVPIPATWWEGQRRQRSVSIALAYTPEVRTTRLDYRATKIRFSFVNANSLDDVSNAFRPNREKGMPERNSRRWISSEKRNLGTLQASRWDFRGRITGNRLFVVITRQDSPWSTVSDQAENYALAVVLDDRAQTEANLYAEVRALLRTRARVRVQT